MGPGHHFKNCQEKQKKCYQTRSQLYLLVKMKGLELQATFNTVAPKRNSTMDPKFQVSKKDILTKEKTSLEIKCLQTTNFQ